MIQITDTIEFDESKLLSEQTQEFQMWYNKNVSILINDTIVPDSLSEFKRPLSYTVTVGIFTIKIYPKYIHKEQSNWSCSDFKLEIKNI